MKYDEGKLFQCESVRQNASVASPWQVYFGLVAKCFPLVKRELAFWKQKAQHIPNSELSRQAVSSIRDKGFHCMGGAVFALINRASTAELVQAIVAIQTISDYLDNLCDRVALKAQKQGGVRRGTTPCKDIEPVASNNMFSCLMRLHEAMLCAVDPLRPTCDYYNLYPIGNDGGYLDELVSTSRNALGSVPGYSHVKPIVLLFAQMYSELQSIKHLPPEVRRLWMEEWFGLYSAGAKPDEAISGKNMLSEFTVPRPKFEHVEHLFEHLTDDFVSEVSRLKWWEFGAAAGSTLGIFSLIAYSSLDKSGTTAIQIDCIKGQGSQKSQDPCVSTNVSIKPRANPGTCYLTIGSAYFPSICALHILLDYLIDQEEDKKFGDLNFISCYGSTQQAVKGLSRFINLSFEKARSLPDPRFHEAVIKGLLAMYLSDPKVEACGLSNAAKQLTGCLGASTEVLRMLCRLIRKIAGF